MARPRNYAAEYARRVEQGLARGFTRTQARGHPEERPGTLGIRDATELKAALASAQEAPEVHIEGDRVHVATRTPDGRTEHHIMSREQWTQVRPKGRPRKGIRRPNIFEYRKRWRRAA